MDRVLEPHRYRPAGNREVASKRIAGRVYEGELYFRVSFLSFPAFGPASLSLSLFLGFRSLDERKGIVTLYIACWALNEHGSQCNLERIYNLVLANVAGALKSDAWISVVRSRALSHGTSSSQWDPSRIHPPSSLCTSEGCVVTIFSAYTLHRVVYKYLLVPPGRLPRSFVECLLDRVF